MANRTGRISVIAAEGPVNYLALHDSAWHSPFTGRRFRVATLTDGQTIVNRVLPPPRVSVGFYFSP